MNSKKKWFAFLLLLLGLVMAGTAVYADISATYTLSKSVVGGGHQGSTGGTYSLSGTAGQAAAQQAVSGGGYTLSSGFWDSSAVCVPVSAVTINGPASGVPGKYAFTAVVTPANATTPLTYAWDNSDTTAVSTRNLTAGTHNLSVTASNCSGTGSATDTHTITISSAGAGCTVFLADVTISGPATGKTGTSYTYSAATTPSNADTPITYTWSPAPASGQGSSSASYKWTTAGTKNVSITASNCGAADSATTAVTISESGNKVYLPIIIK